MRDPQRTWAVCNQIASFWGARVPDWRFGQLIMNFMSWHMNTYHTDAYYIEDDEFMKRFKIFIKEVA